MFVSTSEKINSVAEYLLGSTHKTLDVMMMLRVEFIHIKHEWRVRRKLAEKLCEEADGSGCDKCPHHRARGIEEWTPLPATNYFYAY